MKQDIYRQVINKIIANLEQGELTWRTAADHSRQDRQVQAARDAPDPIQPRGPAVFLLLGFFRKIGTGLFCLILGLPT